MESGTYFEALLSKNCTISYLGELVTISSMISSPSSYPLSSQILELFKHSNLVPFHLFSDLIYSSSYLWGVDLVECRTVVGFCCGERGEQACAKAEDVCCDRPNPVLQVPHQLSFP